jgi:hypothetical protein
MRGSVAAWRLASSAVGRRTALRYLAIGAASALAGSVTAACSSPTLPVGLPAGSTGGPASSLAAGSVTGSGGGPTQSVASRAFVAFAAGTWSVNAPETHVRAGTLVVSPDGTWKLTYTPDTSGQADPSASTPGPDTGQWALAGGKLSIAIDHGDNTAVVTGLPDAVTGDASADITWTFEQSGDPSVDQVQAVWHGATRSLVLTRHRGDDRAPAITLMRLS